MGRIRARSRSGSIVINTPRSRSTSCATIVERTRSPMTAGTGSSTRACMTRGPRACVTARMLPKSRSCVNRRVRNPWPGRISKGFGDVLVFQIRIETKDLFSGVAGRDEADDSSDGHADRADAWASTIMSGSVVMRVSVFIDEKYDDAVRTPPPRPPRYRRETARRSAN